MHANTSSKVKFQLGSIEVSFLCSDSVAPTAGSAFIAVNLGYSGLRKKPAWARKASTIGERLNADAPGTRPRLFRRR